MAMGLLSFGAQALYGLIGLVLTIPLGALMLFLAGKIFKKEISFVSALLPSSIVGLASYGLGLVGPATQNDTVAGVMIAISFLTSVALYLTLPKLLLKLEWNDSLKVGAVWMGLMFAVGFFVGIIMGLIAAIFFMGQMGSFV